MSAKEIVHLMNAEERRVLEALQEAEEGIAIAIERAAAAFLEGGRVIYVGAGTSGRIATMDAAEMPPTFGIDSDRFVALAAGGSAAASVAIEGAEDDEAMAMMEINALHLSSQDVVIGLAASGRTPYVLSALRHARQKGIWTCGIANNPGAPLLEEADHAILLHTGPEVLTGSTRLKAGTSQKLVLNRISTGAMVLAGKVIENLMVDVKATNHKLRERCARIVVQLTRITVDEANEILSRCGWNVRQAIAIVKERSERRAEG
jgi:N-acetylmuramic acid 6-phosphate etherase